MYGGGQGKPSSSKPAGQGITAPEKLAAAHFAKAQQLWQQGLYQDAEREYRAAVRLDPHNPSFHDSLGHFLLSQKRTDEALKELRDAVEESRRAVRLSPNNPKLHLSLARLLDSLPAPSEAEAGMNIDGAVAECQEAIRLDPNDAEAHALLGDMLGPGAANYAVKACVYVAIDEYREAIRLTPQNPLLYYKLEWLYVGVRNYQQAIRLLQEGLQRVPQGDWWTQTRQLEFHERLGEVLQKSGRLQESIDEYSEALRFITGPDIKLKTSDEEHYVRQQLDSVRQAESELGEYLRKVQVVVAEVGNTARANVGVARDLEDQGNLAPAMSQYQKVIDLSLKEGEPAKEYLVEAYHGRVRTLLDKGDSDGAVDESRKEIRTVRNDPGGYTDLGKALEHQRHFSEALTAYRKAFELGGEVQDYEDRLQCYLDHHPETGAVSKSTEPSSVHDTSSEVTPVSRNAPLGKNEVSFLNQSGTEATVKIIGPSAQKLIVPDGQTAHANVPEGTYYILVRYGRSPAEYLYTKGGPVNVTATEKQHSVVRITLRRPSRDNAEARQEFK